VRPSPSSLDRLTPSVRARLKREVGQRCERCGRSDLPLVVHHRQRVADLGSHARYNLEVICSNCHARQHGAGNVR
jgi:5-methylcytosine-specific restriction endonuclease McrA